MNNETGFLWRDDGGVGQNSLAGTVYFTHNQFSFKAC